MRVTAVVGGGTSEFESQDPRKAYECIHGILGLDGEEVSPVLVQITKEPRDSASCYRARATAICLFALFRGRRLNWCVTSPTEVAVFSG